MFKRFIKKIIFSILDTPIGKSIVLQYAKTQPSLAIRAVQKSLDLDDLDPASLPSHLNGFEDLYFLFNCNNSNRLVAQLDLNEAGHLFSVAKSIPNGRLLEVGRFGGGSAVLLATAVNGAEGRLFSIDISDIEDKVIKEFLERYGLASRVDLVVADSRTYKVKPESLDFIFIDGDHSYEGVKADFYNFRDALKVGGHMLFHDYYPWIGVVRFLDEMKENERSFFALERIVGTLAHFKKIKSTS